MAELHGNSGADSAPSIEKPSPAFSAAPRNTSTDAPVSPVQEQGLQLEEMNLGQSNGNEPADDGAELSRVPSQAQKLGKKKSIVIMAALCVCLCVCLCDYVC